MEPTEYRNRVWIWSFSLRRKLETRPSIISCSSGVSLLGSAGSMVGKSVSRRGYTVPSISMVPF